MPFSPRKWSAVAACAAGLAWTGAASGAITVTYTPASAAGLAVSATPGAADNVAVHLVCADDGDCAFRVVERLAVLASAGPGCALTSVQPATVTCQIRRGPRIVRADLGDEDDTLTIARCDAEVRVVADTGSGNDRFTGCATGAGSLDDVRGGEGDDVLIGGRGADRLDGGPGADVLRGGEGPELLLARDDDRDAVHCGTDGTGPDEVTEASAASKSLHDRAVVDPRDGLPPSCEGISSAPQGERTGIRIRPLGVTRMNPEGRIAVRLKCLRSGCTGLARVELRGPGRDIPTVPGGLPSPFEMIGPAAVNAAIVLPLGDEARLRADRDRVRAARVTAFEPSRRGWKITVLTIPVRG